LLDFHGTMAEYLAAKCLLASEHLKPGGIAVAAVDGQPAAAPFLAAAHRAGATRWRASRGADRDAEIRVLEDMSQGAPGKVRCVTRTEPSSSRFR
jgi:UDP-N-acetylmuramoyl-L-alanyl-D-glutamate--2,6-diaminopimelate ligase